MPSDNNYYYISRKDRRGKNESHWSESKDGSRRFWQRPTDDSYDRSYVRRLPSNNHAVVELSKVIKPNYIDTYNYSIRNMSDDGNTELNNDYHLVGAQVKNYTDEVMMVKSIPHNIGDSNTGDNTPETRKLPDRVLTENSGQINARKQLTTPEGEVITEDNEGQPNRVNKIGEGAKKEKENYLANMNQAVKGSKKMNENLEYTQAEFEPAPCWVICRTLVKTGKDQYLSTSSSSSWWDSTLSGNFTRKFYTKKEANEIKQNFEAQSMRNQYQFDIIPFNTAAKNYKESDGGSYEKTAQMGKEGVGLK